LGGSITVEGGGGAESLSPFLLMGG